MTLSRRFASVLLLIGAIGTAAAQSAEPHRYAVISTVGNELSMVEKGMATELRLKAPCGRGRCVNADKVSLKDTSLARTALQAARQAIQTAEPGAPVELFAVSEAELPPPHRVLDGNRFTPPPELAGVLTQDHITHVVLLTARTEEASFVSRDKKAIGRGQVDGVGFYVDRLSQEHSDSAFGPSFFAPFAYLNVVLARVSDGVVLTSAAVRKNSVVSSSDARNGADPWIDMSSAQKVQLLERVLSAGVSEVMPTVLRAL